MNLSMSMTRVRLLCDNGVRMVGWIVVCAARARARSRVKTMK